MRKAIAPGEILKDKRVVLGGAGVLALGAAAAAFYAFGNQQTATTDDTAPTVASAPPAGGPGSPGSPGAPVAANSARPKPSPSPVAIALDRSTSFDNIPKAIPGGTATAATPVGAPPAPAPATAALTPKPAPIRAGVTARGSRLDPFVSRLIEPFQRRPAYEFAAPFRLAGQPALPVPPKNENPDLQFGPLPYVQRRVAGILTNGEVSAILEMGTPGSGATQVVQPGTMVSSGIPGIDDLVVDTITPTSLTLRARDGRTTMVALSAAPEAAGNAGAGPGGGGPGGPTGGRVTGGSGNSGAGAVD